MDPEDFFYCKGCGKRFKESVHSVFFKERYCLRCLAFERYGWGFEYFLVGGVRDKYLRELELLEARLDARLLRLTREREGPALYELFGYWLVGDPRAEVSRGDWVDPSPVQRSHHVREACVVCGGLFFPVRKGGSCPRCKKVVVRKGVVYLSRPCVDCHKPVLSVKREGLRVRCGECRSARGRLLRRLRRALPGLLLSRCENPLVVDVDLLVEEFVRAGWPDVDVFLKERGL